MGCLIWFPALNQAQEAFPAVNGSGWDYSKSRVERSTSGNKIDIILSIVPLVKQKSRKSFASLRFICLRMAKTVYFWIISV